MTESNVDKVLYVYNHFDTKPGEALISNHFLGVGRFRRWAADDLQNGIEEAHALGFVEKADRGWGLTKAGYEKASALRLVGTA